MSYINKMRPSIVCGIVFGLLAILVSEWVILPMKDKSNAIVIILISGLLFFNNLFACLFTKKSNGYQLKWVEGLKAAVQSGIVMGVVYTSFILIQKYIRFSQTAESESVMQYLMYFNIYIILFSIFSAIFGLITSTLLFNQK